MLGCRSRLTPPRLHRHLSIPIFYYIFLPLLAAPDPRRFLPRFLSRSSPSPHQSIPGVALAHVRADDRMPTCSYVVLACVRHSALAPSSSSRPAPACMEDGRIVVVFFRDRRLTATRRRRYRNRRRRLVCCPLVRLGVLHRSQRPSVPAPADPALLHRRDDPPMHGEQARLRSPLP